MKPLKVLVVGSGMYVCGRGTDGYGTILPALAEAKRAGLVDSAFAAVRRPSSLRGLKLKLKTLNGKLGTRLAVGGVDGVRSHRKAVNAYAPDCAIVVTPDATHAAIATDLVQKGVHTLVVKPLTPTLREASNLERLARREGVYGAVEFHKRYDEANLKLAESIAAGRLGEISYVVVEYSQRRSIPSSLFRSWAANTNIFQYLGVHYADIVYFATGARPVRASAVGRMNWLAKRGLRTYDSVQAMIEWEVPAPRRYRFTSAILTNWIDPEATTAVSDQRIKVIGTRGRYESDQKDRGVNIITDAAGVETLNPYFSQFYAVPGTRRKRFAGYGERSVRQFLEDVAAIRDGKTTPDKLAHARPSFREALPSTAVVDAVNRSLAKDGAWVKA